MSLNFTTLVKTNGDLEFAIDEVEDLNPANLDFVSGSQTNGNLEFVVGTVKPSAITLGGVTVSPSTVSEGELRLTQSLSGVTVSPSTTSSAELRLIQSLSGVSLDESVLTSAGVITYNINVDRDPKSKLGSAFDRATPDNVGLLGRFSSSDLLKSQCVVAWEESETLNDNLNIHWLTPAVQNSEVGSAWLTGDKVYDSITAPWANSDKVRLSNANRWKVSDAVNSEIETGFTSVPKHRDHVTSKWDGFTERVVLSLISRFANGDVASIRRSSLWGNGVHPWGLRPPTPVEPVVPVLPTKPVLDFRQLKLKDANLEFLFIDLGALIIMNEVTVTHISSIGVRTSIHPVGLGISLDLESHCWTIRGELLGAESLTFLTRGDVHEVNVNGWLWNFTVQGFDRNRSVANLQYNYEADSSTCLLDSRHAVKTSGTVDSTISAWQLAEKKINDLSFSVDRNSMLDWSLTADSYSYSQLTPIELLRAITTAAGGILTPDMTEDKIHVQPRYKVSPWLWETMTNEECDHVIPEHAIITESMRDESTAQIERVLITGKTDGCKTTNVKRAGTAGLVVGAQVVSDLQQNNAVNTEKARNVFADSGDQTSIGYQVPLLSPSHAYGLIVPGQIVRIANEDGTSVTGLCLSCSIAINSIADIWQNITLEVHYYG